MTAPTQSVSRAELLTAFDGQIEAIRVPIAYRLALVLVAMAMVLLPLVYIGLIVAVGYGVYFHAVHNVTILDSTSAKLTGLAYVAPIIVGSILILFMIKPLFARRGHQARPRVLERQNEPDLFAFVERICQVIGAPTPREIRVDCQVNASASFRRGALSLIGNDLTLTIGLPLVTGLSLRQFAGVLAHEFGHFAQGTGMRLTYIIRSVNHWFSRVVYERDAWDLRLERWAKDVDFRIGVILHLARLFVWLTRRVLFGLMWVGHVISCFMLRQMEFDADRYEARLAGSDTFESTVVSLHLINAATQQAYQGLNSSWDDGRLADDLPALIRTRLDRIPEGAADSVRKAIEDGKTGVFDTHPCDADRVRSAAREHAEGIFVVDTLATLLFSDYPALSREVTRTHYRELLGQEVEASKLVSSAMIAAGEDERQEKLTRVYLYFEGAVGHDRLAFWPEAVREAEALDPAAARTEIEACRAGMQKEAAGARENFEQWGEADRRGMDGTRAVTLLESGFRLQPGAFGLNRTDLDAALGLWNGANATKKRLDESVRPFLDVARRRLGTALRVALQDPGEVAGDCRTATGSLRACLEVCHAMKANAGDLYRLRHELVALTILLQGLQGNEDNESVVSQIRSKAAGLWQRLCKLWEQLSPTPYPFDADGDDATVARHVIGTSIPDAEDVGAIVGAAESAVQRAYGLYYRALSRLVEIALAVEEALGLPPPSNDSDMSGGGDRSAVSTE